MIHFKDLEYPKSALLKLPETIKEVDIDGEATPCRHNEPELVLA